MTPTSAILLGCIFGVSGIYAMILIWKGFIKQQPHKLILGCVFLIAACIALGGFLVVASMPMYQ